MTEAIIAHLKRLENERRLREWAYWELVENRIIPFVDYQIKRILRG